MKTLYLAVDMQRDFMDKYGKLYVPGPEEIKVNIKQLAKKMELTYGILKSLILLQYHIIKEEKWII